MLLVVALGGHLAHGVFQLYQFVLLLYIFARLVAHLGHTVAIADVEIAEGVGDTQEHGIIPLPPVRGPNACIDHAAHRLHDGRETGVAHPCPDAYRGEEKREACNGDAVLTGHIGGGVALYADVQRLQTAVACHAVHHEVGIQLLGDAMFL